MKILLLKQNTMGKILAQLKSKAKLLLTSNG